MWFDSYFDCTAYGRIGRCCRRNFYISNALSIVKNRSFRKILSKFFSFPGHLFVSLCLWRLGFGFKGRFLFTFWTNSLRFSRLHPDYCGYFGDFIGLHRFLCCQSWTQMSYVLGKYFKNLEKQYKSNYSLKLDIWQRISTINMSNTIGA